ncbi:hypothetical protein GCM10027406_13730 [Leifsonia lichenia]
MTSGSALHRIVLSASSLANAIDVYGGALGLSVERRSEGFAWLRTADGVELMVHERPTESSDAAVALTFAVTGLDTAVARWVDAGGTVVDAPAVQPWGERMAVVRDRDGHIACLVERP